jgi:hypothetical protein
MVIFFFSFTSDIVKWNSSSHWSKLHFERHSVSRVSSFDSMANFNRLFDRSLSSYTNSRLLITANNVKLIRLLEYLQDGVISLRRCRDNPNKRNTQQKKNIHLQLHFSLKLGSRHIQPTFIRQGCLWSSKLGHYEKIIHVCGTHLCKLHAEPL